MQKRQKKSTLEHILTILQKYQVTDFENKDFKLKLMPKVETQSYVGSVNSFKYEEEEKEDRKFHGTPTLWDGEINGN